MSAHDTTVDVEPTDEPEVTKAAAFCEGEGCLWRGEWRYGNGEDDTHVDDATEDGKDHEEGRS